MSTPVIGRTAVIKLDNTAIGYAKSVSVSMDVDVIKDYFISGANPDMPAVLEAGNKSFTISIEKAWIDSTYASKVLDGTAVSIEVYPKGEGTGKPKITLTNVILNSYELTIEQDGIVMESISGEAKSITFTTA